jgi:hypothetical protein
VATIDFSRAQDFRRAPAEPSLSRGMALVNVGKNETATRKIQWPFFCGRHRRRVTQGADCPERLHRLAFEHGPGD